MDANIKALIAQVTDNQTLSTTLTESSHVMKDTGMDTLRLCLLFMLIERERNSSLDLAQLRNWHLLSVSDFSRFVSCAEGWVLTPLHRELRSIGIKAIVSLLEGRPDEAAARCDAMFALSPHDTMA